MKKAVILFMVLSVLTLTIQSQKNSGFKYSALIRNSAGNKIVDKELTIRVSICKSANGDDIVYTEEHETRTNNLGVVNFTIGKGEIGLDDLSFEEIDWSNETKYFLNIEVDYNNTGNYVKMGIGQLLSVPYAKFADKAETATKIEDPQTIMQDLELSDNILTISGKDNPTQVDLSKIKNPDILDELGKKAYKDEVYTKSEVEQVVTNKIDDNNRASNSGLEKLIDSKADKDKVYSKEEIDSKLENVNLSGEYYSKSETDSKLDVKADKSDTYTKTETDSKINNKADKSTVQTLSDNMETKLDKTNISDDLLSTDSESVLSANMGNKLKSDIERLSDDINLKLGTKVDVQKGKSLVADDILTSDKQMVRKDKIETLEINDIQTLGNTLNSKADKINIYSKQEINDKILTGDQSKIDKTKIEQLEISDINNLQSSIDNKSNKDEVYSRSEIDSKVDAKQDKLTETPEFISNKGEANGYAGLDSEGKIPASHLPDLNISETFVVNNNTEIFSLPSVNKGNVVVVKNDNKTYINKTGNNNDINDWVELSTPNSGVTTVNNQTGNVTVDKVTIGLSNVENLSPEQIRSGIEERHLPNAAVKKSDMTNYYSKDEINTKILNNDNSLVAKSKIEQLSIDDIDQLADALLLKANENDVYSKSDINTKVLNSDQTKVAKDKIERLTVADIQNLYEALALKADTNTVYTRSKIKEILIEKVNQTDFDNLGNIVDTKLNSSDIADDLNTNNSNKVLSAKMGKYLKELIDAANSNSDNNLNTKVDKVSGKELISSNILTSDKSMIAKDKIETLTVSDIESLNDKLDLKSDLNKVFTKEEISELLNEKENKLGFIPENTSNKGKAGGYAPLNSSGKINESYLPDIAVPSSNTVFVDDEAGLLSISANKGDMAILKDSGKSYVNNGGTSGTINDWTEMSSTGAISSINGKVGAVEITKQDINLENVENKSSETIRSEIVDANIPSTIARKSDLDNYSTTTDINQKLESKSDKSSVYNKTEIDSKLDNLSLDNVYTKSETDNKLEDKANKSDVYTTTQTDNMLTNKAEDSDVYSKTDVDSKISDVTGNINTSVETLNIEIGKKVNKSEVYTITDIDNKILTDDKQKVSKNKIETLELTDISGLNTELDKKLDKTSVINDLLSNDIDKPLSAKQGKVLKDQLDLKSSASEVSNLKSKIAVSENEILNNSDDISDLQSQKVNVSDIRNYLTSDEIDKPLSAAQGKIIYNELRDEKTKTSDLKDRVDNAETNITNNDTEITELQTNKVNVTDVVDNLVSTDSDKPLSAKQGKALKDELETDKTNLSNLNSRVDDAETNITNNDTEITELQTNKVNVTDVVDNLVSTDSDKPLSAKQGKALKDELETDKTNLTNLNSRVDDAETNITNNDTEITELQTNKVNVTDVVDNLTTDVANKPLSAKQGKALKDELETDKTNLTTLTSRVDDAETNITNNDTEITELQTNKINVTDVVDNLVSTDSDKPLSAKQGKALKDELETDKTNLSNLNSRVDDAETNISNNDTEITELQTNKVNVTDVVDNLTTDVANKPLSAKQGKALKDELETDKTNLTNLTSRVDDAETNITNNDTEITELQTNKVNVTDVVDNLTTDVANKPLSAKQGKALKDELETDKTNLTNLTSRVDDAETNITNNDTEITELQTNKVNVTDVVDNLTTDVANKPLSAKQGKALKDELETDKTNLTNLTSRVDDAETNITNNDTEITELQTNKVNVTDVVDNLTTDVANKPLSAKQGKALKDELETDKTNLTNLTSRVDDAETNITNNNTEITELQTNKVNVTDVYNKTYIETTILNAGKTKVDLSKVENLQTKLDEKQPLIYDGVSENIPSLPEASTNTNKLWYVKNISTAYQSDGTNWVRKSDVYSKTEVDDKLSVKQDKLYDETIDNAGELATVDTFTGKIVYVKRDGLAYKYNGATWDVVVPPGSVAKVNSQVAVAGNVTLKADHITEGTFAITQIPTGDKTSLSDSQEEVPTKYGVKTYVEGKILTDDKSKVAKAKIEQLEIADINALQTSLDNKLESTDIAGKANSDDVYAKTEVYNKSEVDTKILTDDKSKVAKTKIEQLEIADINALQTSLDNKLESSDIAGKANSADVYVKTEVYNKSEVDTKILTDDKSKVAKTKIEQLEISDINALQTSLDNKLESSDIAGKANSADVYVKTEVYNKSEVDTKILTDDKSKVAKTKIEQLEISDINALQTSLDNKLESSDIAGKANSADVYTKTEVYNKSEVDTKILTDDKSKVAKTKIEQLEINDINALQTSLDNKLESSDIAGKANSADVYAKTELYNKSEVDTKILTDDKSKVAKTKIEQLEISDINALQTSLDNKLESTDIAGKANSADVYVKTEVYNKSEVDSKNWDASKITSGTINYERLPIATTIVSSATDDWIPSEGAVKKYVDDKVASEGGLWTENGTNAYYNSGNVGIGTTSPEKNLHVNGTIKSDSLLFNTGATISKFSNDALSTSTTSVPTEYAVKSYVDNYSPKSDNQYNTISGTEALKNNTTGSENIASGFQTMINNTSGNHNTAVGYQALYSNTDKSSNTAFGYQTLLLNTGEKNTAIGFGAAKNLTSGSNNIAIGADVELPSPTESNQINIGNTIYGNSSTGNINLINGGSINEFSIDGTLADNSDLAIPTEKAVKTYVDNKAFSGGGLWSASGSNAYFNTGSVGIGTDTPKALFHVNKDEMTSMPIDSWTDMLINDSGSAALQISSGGYSSIFFGSTDNATASEIRRNHSDNKLKFYNNGIWSMAIDSSGNLGVGTSSPKALFHVNKDEMTSIPIDSWTDMLVNDSGSAALQISGGSSSSIFFGSTNNSTQSEIRSTYNDNKLQFLHNGNWRMALDGNGNLGVGTQSPKAKLHISNGTGSTNLASYYDDYPLFIENEGTSIATIAGGENSTRGWGITNSTNHYYSGLILDASEYLHLRHANAYRLTINTSGNVGIGTTSPDNNLHISGSGSPRLKIESTTGSQGSDYPGLVFESDNGNSVDHIGAGIFFNSSNYGNGELYFAVNNYGSWGADDISPTSDAVMTLDRTGTVKLRNGVAINEFSSDTGLSGNSNSAVPTEYAVKTYVDNKVSSSGGVWSKSGSEIRYNSGRVGINTTATLDHALNIFGNIGFGYGDTSSAMYNWLGKTSSSGPLVFDLSWGGANSSYTHYDIRANGTSRLTIRGDGNIGIGNSNPSYKLDINGSARASSLYLNSGQTINEFSSDTGLSGNSNSAVPTENAVRNYISGTMKKGINLTYNTHPKGVFRDLLWTQSGSGTFYPDDIPFYAENTAKAEKIAMYLLQRLVTEFKNLENDNHWDQLHQSTVVNSGILNLLPSNVVRPSGGVDVDNNINGSTYASEYFRLIVASNNSNTIYYTDFQVASANTDHYSFRIIYGTSSGTITTGSSITGISSNPPKVNTSGSIGGSVSSGTVVIAYPVSIELNY